MTDLDRVRAILDAATEEERQEATKYPRKLPPDWADHTRRNERDHVARNLLPAALDVVEAARDRVCDRLVHGVRDQDENYCFSCHMGRPCSGDDLRAALDAYDAKVKETL